MKDARKRAARNFPTAPFSGHRTGLLQTRDIRRREPQEARRAKVGSGAPGPSRTRLCGGFLVSGVIRPIAGRNSAAAAR